MFIIGDGYGRGYTTKVTSKNQLSVVADSMPRPGRACFDGTLHGLTSGAIALTTTGSYSGLLYLINTSTAPCYIWRINAAATVNARWQYVKNPTAGTLISGGSVVTPLNMNFAITTSLVATILKGANGSTVTDGVVLRNELSVAHATAPFPAGIPIILGQSDALAVLCQPTASGDAYVGMSISQEILDL